AASARYDRSWVTSPPDGYGTRRRGHGPGRRRARSRRAPDHRPLLEHLPDQPELPADPQDVHDLELLRVRAGRPDGHVAGPEAEEPVGEQVARVLLHHDAERVVRLLPRPDRRADAELAPAEDQVQLAVVHQDGERPDGEQEQGDGEVTEGVDVDVDDPDGPQDRVPPTQEGEQDHDGDDPQDRDDRPKAPQVDVGDDDHQAQYRDEDHPGAIADGQPQTRLD